MITTDLDIQKSNLKSVTTVSNDGIKITTKCTDCSHQPVCRLSEDFKNLYSHLAPSIVPDGLGINVYCKYFVFNTVYRKGT